MACAMLHNTHEVDGKDGGLVVLATTHIRLTRVVFFCMVVARVDAIAYFAMGLMLFVYTVIYQESSLPWRTRSWFHLTTVILGVLGFIWIWVPSLLFLALGTSYFFFRTTISGTLSMMFCERGWELWC